MLCSESFRREAHPVNTTSEHGAVARQCRDSQGDSAPPRRLRVGGRGQHCIEVGNALCHRIELAEVQPRHRGERPAIQRVGMIRVAGLGEALVAKVDAALVVADKPRHGRGATIGSRAHPRRRRS
jgi:hypothetical protein